MQAVNFLKLDINHLRRDLIELSDIIPYLLSNYSDLGSKFFKLDLTKAVIVKGEVLMFFNELLGIKEELVLTSILLLFRSWVSCSDQQLLSNSVVLKLIHPVVSHADHTGPHLREPS